MGAMKRGRIILISGGLAVAVHAWTPVAADEFQETVLPVLEKYCLDCHDGEAGKPKGGFDLFPFYTLEDARGDRKAMLHVRNALHYREMPPEERTKQPDEGERVRVIEWIDEEILRQPSFRGHRDPGPPVMRRMTRLEYNNSVRDLLGLGIDVFSFPERLMARRDYFDPDRDQLPAELDISIPEYGSKVPSLLKIANLPGDSGAEHGYLNQGDTLNVTPLLMERYLTVANEIVHHADFADEAHAAAGMLGIQPRSRAGSSSQSKQRSGAFLATVGRDFAPVDNIEANAPGNSDQAWLFRDHIAAAFDEGTGGVFQHPDDIGARVPGKGGVIRAVFGRDGEKALLINPTEDLWFVDFATAHETSPPANIANGRKEQKEFRLNLKLDGVRENEGILAAGVVVLSRDRNSAGPVTLTAHYTNGDTASLTDEITTGAGVDNTFFSWQAPPGEAITDISVDGSRFSGDYVLLDDLGFLTGKVATREDKAPADLSRTAEPKQEGEGEPTSARDDPKAAFARFASRAFRHPVTEDELGPFYEVYERGVGEGLSREDAMREAIRTVLSSPRFLFYVEKPREGEDPVREVSGLEFANRAAAFLWSSVPDEELFSAAVEGKLENVEGRRAQVQRMMRNPKIKELSDSFAYQWLQLNVLLGSQPNPRRFGEFYSGPMGKTTLAAPLMQEALLLFETVLIENRDPWELIDPNFTWLNPALIQYYGWEKEFAELLKSAESLDKNGRMRLDNDKWFRCELPDRTRGGVLCMGSTLTLTSLPLRTSPVYRGAWVTEVVFNRAPPPPPAAVDELGADDREMQEAGMTLRQKIELHREKESCSGCHSRIDPLGFPLENFDPIGRWRDSYGQFPVDAGGVLMREHDYDGIASFKDAIRAREEDFRRGLIRHLLAFALGRHLEPFDEWAVEEIEEETRGKGLRDVIVAVTESYPFTHTRNVSE